MPPITPPQWPWRAYPTRSAVTATSRNATSRRRRRSRKSCCRRSAVRSRCARSRDIQPRQNMNDLNGYDIEDLKVGMTATFAKTITEADIVLFAGASGDNNAVHINEEFAATTVFKGRIAHGMLTASVISAAIANKLPGPGTIYMRQNLVFKAPVRAGDTVHAKVTVSKK